MVPLSLKHVVFQEGDVAPHHLDESLAEKADSRDATSATDRGTFLAPSASRDARPSIAATKGLLERSGLLSWEVTFGNPDDDSDRPCQASTCVLPYPPHTDPNF